MCLNCHTMLMQDWDYLLAVPRYHGIESHKDSRLDIACLLTYPKKLQK